MGVIAFSSNLPVQSAESMPNYTLLIFDLDGTLIDSLADLTEAVNHVRTLFSLPTLTQMQVRGMVGQGARNLIEKALPGAEEYELDKGLQLFIDYNHSHLLDNTTLYPGVKDTLRQLREQGRTLTVVSNKNTDLCQLILDNLGIGYYFSTVLGADALAERKPSPLPLLNLMQHYRNEVHTTLMIGDSINDISAGRAAGVATVGCSFGYGDTSELADANWQIDSFPKLLLLPI